MLLYRPTGMAELRLVFESKARAWPPRLPEQPIFYPVFNFGYAAQIARDWNSTTAPFAGYVTRFELDDNYGQQFERHIVGGREHEELWVPAEELSTFNQHLTAPIDVVAAFFGPEFRGSRAGVLAGLDASERRRRRLEDPAATYLDYPFWVFAGAVDVVELVRSVWHEAGTGVPLPSLALQP